MMNKRNMIRIAEFIFIAFLILVCPAQMAVAQNKLPLIKARSKKVSIRDGSEFKADTWTIVPDARPDIYTTYSKRVTFYTDLDSISFNTNPKTGVYDFIILLNGKDSAYTRISCEMSYLEKLEKAKDYNISDDRPVPKFSYQSMDNPSLVRLRHDFKLDSVAGTGNEISRILNLMHWVHNIVKHDGNSDNPALRNAADLINACKTGKRGLNCRMMATILNECYLSLGIKSRFITCMPRETNFTDCHVINMVYSNDLKRWIWIDPTFDAYVMDENGSLLGLREVRERLINGQTLILNPEANWNRQNTQTKEYYLETYMAKNLYRLQTPLVSETDTETWRKGKEVTFVELLPLDGIEQAPQRREEVNLMTGVKFTYIKTNNPGLFWTNPE